MSFRFALTALALALAVFQPGVVAAPANALSKRWDLKCFKLKAPSKNLCQEAEEIADCVNGKVDFAPTH
jgi:hypothetical protein